MPAIISKTKLSLLVSSMLFITACSNQHNEKDLMNDLTPPIAKKVPHEMVIHNHTRIDDYYWMRDDSRTNPEILAHLEAENDYIAVQLKHTEAMQEKIFEEIKGRINKDDNSVPIKEGDYYYSRQMEGENEYPIHVRTTDFNGSNLEVLLDVNELAKNHEYYSINGLRISPNAKILA
jgi:oligopeptidase B